MLCFIHKLFCFLHCRCAADGASKQAAAESVPRTYQRPTGNGKLHPPVEPWRKQSSQTSTLLSYDHSQPSSGLAYATTARQQLQQTLMSITANLQQHMGGTATPAVRDGQPDIAAVHPKYLAQLRHEPSDVSTMTHDNLPHPQRLADHAPVGRTHDHTAANSRDPQGVPPSASAALAATNGHVAGVISAHANRSGVQHALDAFVNGLRSPSPNGPMPSGSAANGSPPSGCHQSQGAARQSSASPAPAWQQQMRMEARHINQQRRKQLQQGMPVKGTGPPASTASPPGLADGVTPSESMHASNVPKLQVAEQTASASSVPATGADQAAASTQNNATAAKTQPIDEPSVTPAMEAKLDLIARHQPDVKTTRPPSAASDHNDTPAVSAASLEQLASTLQAYQWRNMVRQQQLLQLWQSEQQRHVQADVKSGPAASTSPTGSVDVPVRQVLPGAEGWNPLPGVMPPADVLQTITAAAAMLGRLHAMDANAQRSVQPPSATAGQVVRDGQEQLPQLHDQEHNKLQLSASAAQPGLDRPWMKAPKDIKPEAAEEQQAGPVPTVSEAHQPRPDRHHQQPYQQQQPKRQQQPPSSNGNHPSASMHQGLAGPAAVCAGLPLKHPSRLGPHHNRHPMQQAWPHRPALSDKPPEGRRSPDALGVQHRPTRPYMRKRQLTGTVNGILRIFHLAGEA